MARWHRWRLAGRGESAPLRPKPDQATPLPSKDMMVIFLTHVSQGFQVTMLFPLIVFMVTGKVARISIIEWSLAEVLSFWLLSQKLVFVVVICKNNK